MHTLLYKTFFSFILLSVKANISYTDFFLGVLFDSYVFFILLCFTAVLYLLGNPGGITIFGWIVDRTFLNTILMLELTLVLFVLSKTVVVPAKTLVLDYIRFP